MGRIIKQLEFGHTLVALPTSGGSVLSDDKFLSLMSMQVVYADTELPLDDQEYLTKHEYVVPLQRMRELYAAIGNAIIAVEENAKNVADDVHIFKTYSDYLAHVGMNPDSNVSHLYGDIGEN